MMAVQRAACGMKEKGGGLLRPLHYPPPSGAGQELPVEARAEPDRERGLERAVDEPPPSVGCPKFGFTAPNVISDQLS